MPKKRSIKRRRAKPRQRRSLSIFQRIGNFFKHFFEAPSERGLRQRKNNLVKIIKAKGYSPSYEKRLIRAVEKGKATTLQEARGHRPGEAARRREREIEEHGLTTPQLKAIRNFHSRWYKSGKFHRVGGGRDFKDVTVEEMIEETQRNGYEWFVAYRSVITEQERRYKRQLYEGTYVKDEESFLDMLAEKASVPRVEWYFYH